MCTRHSAVRAGPCALAAPSPPPCVGDERRGAAAGRCRAARGVSAALRRGGGVRLARHRAVSGAAADGGGQHQPLLHAPQHARAGGDGGVAGAGAGAGGLPAPRRLRRLQAARPPARQARRRHAGRGGGVRALRGARRAAHAHAGLAARGRAPAAPRGAPRLRARAAQRTGAHAHALRLRRAARCEPRCRTRRSRALTPRRKTQTERCARTWTWRRWCACCKPRPTSTTSVRLRPA